MIPINPIVSHRRSSVVNHNSINSSAIYHEKRSRSTNTKKLSWTKPANTAITTAAYGKHANFEDFLNDYGNKLGRFDTWSGVLASGIRGFTQGMLAGNDFAGFNSEDIDHVNGVAGFGANMAAGGFEFATTGKTTFNILQFKDVGTAALTFDINEGISGELFSQGGHQLNFSAAIKGLGAFAFNNAVRRYERTGEMDILKGYRGTTDAGAALRSNYSFGDDNARSQAWSIAREDTLLRVGGRLSNDGDGNHLGVTTMENGRRVVHLSTLGRKGDIASQLQAGTVLQWEAHRDGRNNGFQGQLNETVRAAGSMAIMAHNLAASRRYGRDFRINGQQAAIMQAIAQGGIEGLAEHVAANYDFTSGDNWKVILGDDNSIKYQWDGTHSLSFEGFEGTEEQKAVIDALKGKRIDQLSDEEKGQLVSILQVMSGGTQEDAAQSIMSNFNTVQDVSKLYFTATKDPEGKSLSIKSVGDYLQAVHKLRGTNALKLNDLTIAPAERQRQLANGDIMPFGMSDGDQFKVTTLYGDRLDPRLPENTDNYGTWFGPHPQIDLGSQNINEYLAFNSGQLEVRYDNTLGLAGRVSQKGAAGGRQEIGHMNSASLQDWLAVAMSKGTTTQYDSTSSRLIITGIKQGTRIGSIGNTGFSGSAHADIKFERFETDANGRTSYRSFDPLKKYFPDNGIVKNTDYIISPYAPNYSGYEELKKIQERSSLSDPQLRTSFDKYTRYYDNSFNENVSNQIRMQRWNRLMGQLGKTSFDFAMELQREFPDSSTVQDYFQERYRQHQQEQHYRAMTEYWQNANLDMYRSWTKPPSFWDTVRDWFKL